MAFYIDDSHRPQLEYALRDVQHLHAMYDYLQAEITLHDRQAWFDEDMETARLVFHLYNL